MYSAVKCLKILAKLSNYCILNSSSLQVLQVSSSHLHILGARRVTKAISILRARSSVVTFGHHCHMALSMLGEREMVHVSAHN